jgi:hypothetical protein
VPHHAGVKARTYDKLRAGFDGPVRLFNGQHRTGPAQYFRHFPAYTAQGIRARFRAKGNFRTGNTPGQKRPCQRNRLFRVVDFDDRNNACLSKFFQYAYHIFSSIMRLSQNFSFWEGNLEIRSFARLKA